VEAHLLSPFVAFLNACSMIASCDHFQCIVFGIHLDADKLIGNSRLGTAAREKLKKVIGWVKANEFILHNVSS